MKNASICILITILSSFLMIGCENDDANYDEFQANNDSSSEKIDSEDFDITDKSVDLDSIFLGRLIFIGNQYDFNQNPDIQYDLRYNPRFLEFNHPIFSADEVTDEEIMNWARMNLNSGIMSFNNHTFVMSDSKVDPFWAVINLDNGKQIAIVQITDNGFGIAYRQQNSTAPVQKYIDWWDIDYGIFSLSESTIEWQNLTRNN